MMRTAKQALTEPPIPEWATNNEPTRQSEIVKQRLAYIKPGENAFNATDMPEELRLNVRGAKLSQIYKRLDPNKPAYTVTGSGGGGTHIYHWEEPRALTNRERARLQTFPDWYKFIGSKENVRRQIGMAVPPDGAQVIFEALFKTLEGIPYDNIEGDHYESIEPNIDIEKRIYKLEEKELEEKDVFPWKFIRHSWATTSLSLFSNHRILRTTVPGMSCGRLPGISRELPFSARCTRLISPPDDALKKPAIGAR